MPFPLNAVPAVSYKLLDLIASVVYLGHIRRQHSLQELELGMLVSKEDLPRTYPNLSIVFARNTKKEAYRQKITFS